MRLHRSVGHLTSQKNRQFQFRQFITAFYRSTSFQHEEMGSASLRTFLEVHLARPEDGRWDNARLMSRPKVPSALTERTKNPHPTAQRWALAFWLLLISSNAQNSCHIFLNYFITLRLSQPTSQQRENDCEIDSFVWVFSDDERFFPLQSFQLYFRTSV